jgi:hypothetical protein
MEKTKVNSIIAVLLIVTNLIWGLLYFTLRSELVAARMTVKERDMNAKVVSFSRQFIEDVLRAKTEVDFETRLKLENAVRDMKDKEVLAQWGKFINSKTEAEAQDEVKALLALLMAKISVK